MPSLPRALPPRGGRFAGRRVLVLAAVVMGMSGPGQTAGISVLIDPMVAGLDLTRSEVATAYLVGTLAGSAAMPRIGRFVDERGPRLAVALVGGGFGVLLAAVAGVQGLVTLTVGFVGIRMLGQGALPLIATTSVAVWFRRRRGAAIGLTTALGAALISVFPLVSSAVVQAVGWRTTWLVLGATAVVVLPLIAVAGMIDRPADVGQRADGEVATEANRDGTGHAEGLSFTRAQAVRTPMFWAVTGAVATTSMIGTGLQFHQIDLLGEQGLSATEAAANFLPQTAAGLAATFGVGALIDRVATRWVLLVSMTGMVTAMLTVQLVRPGWPAVLYGVLLGAAGAGSRSLEAASFPRLFGLAHLGAIRGTVAMVMVAATAFGPLLLALGRDLTGGYAPVLGVLAGLPVAVAVVGLLAPQPRAT